MSDFVLRHMHMEEDLEKKSKKKMSLGTTTAGISINLVKKGIEINGYYKLRADDDDMYRVLREPLIIHWEDLEKLKEQHQKKKKVKKETNEGVEKPFDIEYLKTLPKVHLNNMLYYIDVENKEMRLVSSPILAYKL